MNRLVILILSTLVFSFSGSSSVAQGTFVKGLEFQQRGPFGHSFFFIGAELRGA